MNRAIKKLLVACIFGVLMLSASVARAGAEATQPSDPDAYRFADAGVEAKARRYWEKGENEFFTVSEWESITEFPPASFDGDSWIREVTIESLEDFRRCPLLHSLFLDQALHIDFSPLRDLPALQTLKLSPYYGEANWASLAELSQLRSLDITVSYLPSGIEALAKMQNLAEFALDCAVENAKDVSSLASLSNLTHLYLSTVFWDGDMQGGVDLSPLGGLTSLIYFQLSENSRAKDFRFLANLPNFTHLNLAVGGVEDQSSFADLHNMTHLIGTLTIIDTSYLAGLTNLTSIDLFDCSITKGDFEVFTSLPNLTEFLLQWDSVRNLDLSLLANLPHLTRIRLATTGFDSSEHALFDALRNLPALRELEFHDNNISDLSPFQSLTNLIKLDLRWNGIEDITPLQSLKNLRVLNLSGNSLTQEQIDELQSALPLCEIIFPAGPEM